VSVLCTLRVPFTSCVWFKKASFHNTSQRETFDWPTGSTAQQDLFDFKPTSVMAVISSQQESQLKKMNVLITFRHLHASQGANAS